MKLASTPSRTQASIHPQGTHRLGHKTRRNKKCQKKSNFGTRLNRPSKDSTTVAIHTRIRPGHMVPT